MSIAAAGGDVTDEELAAAGMSRNAFEAMKAISSGDEEAAIEHVKAMSYPEMEETFTGYIEDGEYDKAKEFLDYLYDAEAIQDPVMYQRWLKMIIAKQHAATDTTVATGGITGGASGTNIIK